MSSAGYLLLYTKRSRGIIYLAFALVGVATLLSGSRGAVVIAMATALILSVGFLWGAPWRQRQAHRLVKTIRRSAMVAFLASRHFCCFSRMRQGRELLLHRDAFPE